VKIKQAEMERRRCWLLHWGLAVLLIVIQGGGRVEGGEVTYDGRSLIIDGSRNILFSGSIHYPRSTPQVNVNLLEFTEKRKKRCEFCFNPPALFLHTIVVYRLTRFITKSLYRFSFCCKWFRQEKPFQMIL
jgi:hypothetical protein